MLLLAMNEEHLQLLEYFVGCSVAMALQTAGSDNRLHDKDLEKKVRKALLGQEEDNHQDEARQENLARLGHILTERKLLGGGIRRI